jgi:predicted transcriptional regulator
MEELNKKYKIIMLKASHSPIIITKLMRDTHTEHVAIMKYLDYLISKGYMKETTELVNPNRLPKHQYIRKYYSTTNKGKELLTEVSNNGSL